MSGAQSRVWCFGWCLGTVLAELLVSGAVAQNTEGGLEELWCGDK